MTEMLTLIRQAAAKRIVYGDHAQAEMLDSEPPVERAEVEQVIGQGILVEDYPEDARGRSALILGWGNQNRPIHVVCSPKPEILFIITVYVCDPDRWDETFTRRR
jgi:hypothetical protein